ncbi:MAG: hypothetical protein AB3N23_15650 [Paracoccaceae bacterium]
MGWDRLVKSTSVGAFLAIGAAAALAEGWDEHTVWLEDADGTRIEIATLSGTAKSYKVEMNEDAFSEHFLSMRPFKCLDGPDKTWCHVPYPYDIARNTSADLIDLEYDFLFVWKGRTDYGIDMWNGVYYRLSADGDSYVGNLHEMNMDKLAVPPEDGELRPIRDVDLEEGDPDSHWLPILRIAPPG